MTHVSPYLYFLQHPFLQSPIAQLLADDGEGLALAIIQPDATFELVVAAKQARAPIPRLQGPRCI